MKKLTFCLIGNDHFIVNCAKLLLANKYVIKFIFTEQSNVVDWRVDHDVSYYLLNAIVIILNSIEDFDYLLTISNSLIIKEEIFSALLTLFENREFKLVCWGGASRPLFG